MNMLDGKFHEATEGLLRAPWSCGKPGEFFRCYLCGHKFALGELWRFVFDNDATGAGKGNFLVCAGCDGPDVRARWKARVEEGKRVFWWMAKYAE